MAKETRILNGKLIVGLGWPDQVTLGLTWDYTDIRRIDITMAPTAKRDDCLKITNQEKLRASTLAGWEDAELRIVLLERREAPGASGAPRAAAAAHGGDGSGGGGSGSGGSSPHRGRAAPRQPPPPATLVQQQQQVVVPHLAYTAAHGALMAGFAQRTLWQAPDGMLLQAVPAPARADGLPTSSPVAWVPAALELHAALQQWQFYHTNFSFVLLPSALAAASEPPAPFSGFMPLGTGGKFGGDSVGPGK